MKLDLPVFQNWYNCDQNQFSSMHFQFVQNYHTIFPNESLVLKIQVILAVENGYYLFPTDSNSYC